MRRVLEESWEECKKKAEEINIDIFTELVADGEMMPGERHFDDPSDSDYNSDMDTGESSLSFCLKKIKF